MAERRWTALLRALVLLYLRYFQHCGSFNLDVDKPSVFSGPQGSYFGFSVDFFKPSNVRSDVLIGAPRANTSDPSNVVERGAVYTCPWKSASCQQIQFDNTDDRKNTDGAQMEFKSKQWFGASVRSFGENILACAPLYQWSTFGVSEREPVGTCFLKKADKVVEYSPCRSSELKVFYIVFKLQQLYSTILILLLITKHLFSSGQLISDDISEVFTRINNNYINPYSNTMATKSAGAQYDDSYLGKLLSLQKNPLSLSCRLSRVFLLCSDYVTGVPRGDKALGYVNIFNGLNMESMVNFSGTQMAAYFGHSVAATDINRDGMVDMFVGAPLFMDRGSDGKLREVGQVSVYLGRGGFSFQAPQHLTGSEVYARYGSSIAALGDLDRDGFNDVAIAAPYGGPDHAGLVYIHNGRSRGPDPTPSQVLQGRWASSYMPASFGYSMSGNTDIDQNGYPDLVVGVFGADKAVLYRARPVISVNATLDLTPQIINPDEKSCTIPSTTTKVSCFKVKYCLTAFGLGAPPSLVFKVDLTLDRLKQKEATKRVLFLHTKSFQYQKNMTARNDRSPACEELDVFLRDDREFKDKITPISVTIEYSLDYQKASDATGLLPILSSSCSPQAHILLDCGEDNICKPDLKLSVKRCVSQRRIKKPGEGAYEAELHVSYPQQADFTGVVRNETLTRLSCASKKENNTKMVVCDLGNPMKGGTKFNNISPRVSSTTQLAVLAKVAIRGYKVSTAVLHPCSTKDSFITMLLFMQLLNNGPSTFSKASLEVDWPYHYRNGSLLYITSFDTEGPINCTTDIEINPLNVSKNVTGGIPPREQEGEGRNRNHVRKRDLESVREDCSTAKCLQLKCQVGRLERGKNAIVFVYSRLDVNNFLRVSNRSYTIQSRASFSVIEIPYKKLDFDLPSNSTTVSGFHSKRHLS
uniref:Integrin, alpha V n=1 Tax=Neogobius melanostomus TaxID=47308 RepID=A0A8C6SJX3_9GOBI